MPTAAYEERFLLFQGENDNVIVEYVSSNFVDLCSKELDIFEKILAREERGNVLSTASYKHSSLDDCAITADRLPSDFTLPDKAAGILESTFNVVVDLCGIFKRSKIHEIRDLLLRYLGPDRFHYVYYIDQGDASDRVLHINSNNDVPFD